MCVCVCALSICECICKCEFVHVTECVGSVKCLLLLPLLVALALPLNANFVTWGTVHYIRPDGLNVQGK